MLETFRNAIFKLLYFSGVGEFLRILQTRNKVPVLVFHRITDKHDPYTEPLAPPDFDSFISCLKRKYKIRPLSDLFSLDAKALRGSCFITFDDAMEDFYYNAVPIIKKHHVPITLFIPTAAVLEESQLWSHRYFACFLFAKKKNVNLRIADKNYHFNLQKDSEYQKVMALHNVILTSSIEIREEILTLLESKFLPEEPYKTFASVMGPAELKKLPKEVSYGSHSVTHSYLPVLPDEILRKELEVSKKEIERLLRAQCNIVAYPNGGIKKEQLNMVGKCYSYGFAVGNQLIDLSKMHESLYKLQLPRINVNDKSVFELYLRINGFHYLIGRIAAITKSPLNILRGIIRFIIRCYR